MRVESAGFAAHGRPSPPHAVAAAARHGIDLAGHTSQLLVAPVARAADLIVVMEELQRRTICERFGRAARDVLLLGDLDPMPVTSRALEPDDAVSARANSPSSRTRRCVTGLTRGSRAASGSWRAR